MCQEIAVEGKRMTWAGHEGDGKESLQLTFVSPSNVQHCLWESIVCLSRI